MILKDWLQISHRHGIENSFLTPMRQTRERAKRNHQDQQLEDFFRVSGAGDDFAAAAGALTKCQLAKSLATSIPTFQ